MSLQIIKRRDGEKAEKETINRIREDAPQISYSSEGRVCIRIPQYEGDTLIVLGGVMAGEAYHNGRDWIRNECYLKECFGYTATHWMPLPEPPKGDTK